jgi:hypothetical protein
MRRLVPNDSSAPISRDEFAAQSRSNRVLWIKVASDPDWPDRRYLHPMEFKRLRFIRTGTLAAALR